MVLGVSMAPAMVRMVLIEGENADGVAVEEDNFEVATTDDSATADAIRQVIAAILGTREGAIEAGYQLSSIGVTWTDQVEAAALRDALAAYKIENVMLLSAFLAAAALTQAVGGSIGYDQTAMLFVEPEIATLAVVDSADGSITDVCRQPLRTDRQNADTVAELADMVTGLKALETLPDGLFVVGSGVDVAPIKAQLEAATSLAVSAPEEPEMGLARGAALASANAPLFASSTAALAYAQDPGAGQIDAYALAPEHIDVTEGADLGDDGLAYSAVTDEEADACTAVLGAADDLDESRPRRRPVLLVGSALAVIFIIAVVALEIALAIDIRPTVALRPNPGQNLIVPTEQAPAPAPPQVSAPRILRQPAPVVQPKPANAAAPPSALNAPPSVPPPPAAPVPAAVPAGPPAPMPLLPAPLPLVAPGAPGHVPAPRPPAHVPAPEGPPARQWAPQPPAHVPAPEGPPARQWVPQPPVHMPAPEAPPVPVMPAPEAPAAPAMPPAGPQLPQIFTPGGHGPQLSPGGGDGSGGGGIFGGPGFGGHNFGGGDFGGHGFGGFGGHGFGGFGGHGFGGFGGGFGGGRW